MATRITDVALCFEGGGMRASYTGAFSRAILEAGLEFPYVCGISAGCSLSLNHVARDWQRSHQQFVEYAQDPRFGGPRHFVRGDGYFNSEYLYEGCIADGTVPFAWETFLQNPAEVSLEAFSADTGRVHQWHKRDFADVLDMARRARASSTMPILMNPITVDGELMFDGGLGPSGGLPHPMALRDGYERLVVITTRPKGYRKRRFTLAQRRATHLSLRRYPRVRDALLARAASYNQALDQLEDLERSGRALVIRPEQMPVGNATLRVPRLEQAWQLGEAQAERELERVAAFVGA